MDTPRNLGLHLQILTSAIMEKLHVRACTPDPHLPPIIPLHARPTPSTHHRAKSLRLQIIIPLYTRYPRAQTKTPKIYFQRFVEFIFELSPPNACPSLPRASGIASLHHEILHVAMDQVVIVIAASTQRKEILRQGTGQ